MTTPVRWDGTAAPDIGAYEYLHATADTDGDGLQDDDEIGAHGTDPTLADTDGDKMRDKDELDAGTDPTDATSFLAITSLLPVAPGNAFAVTWQSVSGKAYTLERATALRMLDPFAMRREHIPGLAGYTCVTDSTTTAGEYFYRIRVE